MLSFLDTLRSSTFMPHGMCYLWQPSLIGLHAASDTTIALAYALIPITLVYFVRKRQDLPFNWMFLMFGLFIFGCGTTHVMEVWTIWHSNYWLAGFIKLFTAGASVVTAGMLVWLIPTALALPSPDQLRATNVELAREIAARKRTEEALEQSRADLEVRVHQRTAELADALLDLRAEMDRRQRAEHERQEAEKALRLAQGELAHVVRVTTMGELAGSIAHEVNQPLTAVVTNANACLRWMAASPPNLSEARDSVTRIVRDADRASEVIRRIRGLLKKAPPRVAPQDLNELIREVVLLLQTSLERNHVEAVLDLTPVAPPVVGDRVQLQQVMLNLVMNGVEAMTHVTDRPRSLVVSSTVTESGQVEARVTDAGTGVAAPDLARLFDPFFTTKPTGMGLGLSVSRSIVEGHGGRLWASNNTGSGATFHFTLPVVATS